jgi:hypothetical protein
MPRVTLVRYATKPDRADENEALARAVFAELKATKPDHIAYALFRDGRDFMHVFINTVDDSADALTGMAAFKAFGADAKDRYQAEPEVSRTIMDLVASYGLNQAMAPT